MSRRWKLKCFGLMIIVMPSLIVIINRCLERYEASVLIFKPLRLSDSDKWIITTDQSNLIIFTSQSNWNILQINSYRRCGQLSTKEAVLQAINSGARYIYITHLVDESTSKILSRFEYNNSKSAIKYNGIVSDPIELHFHNNKNTSQLNRPTSFQYQLGIWNTSLVQKLVQPAGKDNRFQHRAPALLLAPKDMSPFTFNNILFHYDSFWAIVPITKTVVWSLWVQRLLQELKNSVKFSTNHDVKSDECVIKEETNISVIKNDLNNWKCTDADRTSFISCMLKLSNYLLKLGHFSNNDYVSVEKWVGELLKHGYQQPNLPPNITATSLKTSQRIYRILYHPNYRQTEPSNFKPFCKNVTLPQCEMKSNIRFKSLNILLVIVFNRPGYYNVIRYLESVYRPYFKYILYCGQKLESVFTHYNSLNMPISFVEVQGDFFSGTRGYQCLRLAMQMNYDVEGYLHLGDDVLLNIWNLRDIPTDKIWFQQSMRPANISQPTVPDVWRNKSWWPWASGQGHGALDRAIKDLRSKALHDNSVKSFLKQLAENAGGSHRAFYEVCDIFYIPQTLSVQFSNVVKIFDYHNVFLEIAIPTIINGLTDQKDIQLLQGTYLWYEDRKLYRERFNFTKVFLHSLKPSPCLADKTCTEFMCKKYIPCLKELILET